MFPGKVLWAAVSGPLFKFFLFLNFQVRGSFLFWFQLLASSSNFIGFSKILFSFIQWLYVCGTVLWVFARLYVCVCFHGQFAKLPCNVLSSEVTDIESDLTMEQLMVSWGFSPTFFFFLYIYGSCHINREISPLFVFQIEWAELQSTYWLCLTSTTIFS